MDCSLPGSSLYGIFQAKNTGINCHFLLQGIFPTHRSNLGLPHCRQTLYHLSYQGSPGTQFRMMKYDMWSSDLHKEDSSPPCLLFVKYLYKKHLNSTYYVSGTVLSTLQVLTNLHGRDLINTLCVNDKNGYPIWSRTEMITYNHTPFVWRLRILLTSTLWF